MGRSQDKTAPKSPSRHLRSSSAPKDAAARAVDRRRSMSRSRQAKALKERIQAEYNKQLKIQMEALKAAQGDRSSRRSCRRDSPSPRYYKASSHGSNRDKERPSEMQPSSRSRSRRRSRVRRSLDRRSLGRRSLGRRSPGRRSLDWRSRERKSRDRRSRDWRSRDRRPYSRSRSLRRYSRSRSWGRRERTPPRRVSRDRRERSYRRRLDTPPRRGRSRSRTGRSRRSNSRSRFKEPNPQLNVKQSSYQYPLSAAQDSNAWMENNEIIRRAASKWKKRPSTVPTSFKHPSEYPNEERRPESCEKWSQQQVSQNNAPIISPNPLAALPAKHPLVTKGHLDQEKGVVWMPTPILEPITPRIPFLNAKPTGYAGKPRPMMTCSAHGRRRSVWDLKLNESGFWECLPGSKCVDQHGLAMPSAADKGNVLKRYKEKLMLDQKMACHVAAAQEQAARMLKLNEQAGKAPVPPLPQTHVGFPR